MGLKDAGIVSLGVVFVGLCVIAIIASIAYEINNPCLEYGPRELSHMQKVGDTYQAVYRQPCIRRTNDDQ